MFLQWNTKNSCASLLLLNFFDCFLFIYFFTKIDNESRSLNIISLFRLSNIHPINIILLYLDGLSFRLRKFDIKNKFTCYFLGAVDVFSFESTDFNKLEVIFIKPLLNSFLFCCWKLLNFL